MRNSKVWLVLVAMMATSSAHSQVVDVAVQEINPEINFFQGTFDEAVQKAKDEKKFLFVDAYAVWCGPCKYMSKYVFTDLKVAEFFNANFINYKYDMEKGEGPAFAIERKVAGYPTLIFLKSDGKELDRNLGGLTVEQLLDRGQKVVSKYSKQ